MSKTITHHDRLGQELALDDWVAFPNSASSILVGMITKLNSKMLAIKTSNGRRYLKYPSECVKLDGESVTYAKLIGNT